MAAAVESVSVGLADDVEAERLRRRRAADRAAEEVRDRERRAEAERAIAAWYAKRPWASPSDPSPDTPSGEYRKMLLEAVDRIPGYLWKRGVLYPDPYGKEVFASRTRGTRWRRGLYTRYVRWVSADDLPPPSRDSNARGGPYASFSEPRRASWAFTLLDDGRVTRLFGDVDEIRQRVIKMILDGI
jgi:hypothetical protein